MLYECLTGASAFADDAAAAAGRAVPVRQLRPDTWPEVEAVVRTALATAPAQRLQSARELRNALRHPVSRYSGTVAWGRFLRHGWRVLAWGHRQLWRFVRYALRHPLQALVEVLVVWVGLSMLWRLALHWASTHQEVVMAALALLGGLGLLAVRRLGRRR